MPSSGQRSAAGLIAVCMILLLHFHLLKRLNLNHNFITETKSPHLRDANATSLQQTVGASDQSVTDRDLYVSFDHVFGENHTSNITQSSNSILPPEGEWLLSTLPSSAVNRNSSNRIPRIINKIYFQRDGQFQDFEDPMANPDPKQMMAGLNLQSAHRSWSLLNPGYHVRYYNLYSAREYLYKHFHPAFLRAFDCIQAFACKSDLFRIALLFVEGGFHTDWKQECLEFNLLDRIANETDFFAALDKGGAFVTRAFISRRPCVQNAFIGSTAKHPILAKYLEMILMNVQKSYYPTNNNPLHLTGPCVFGRAVKYYRKDVVNDTLWPVYEKNHYYWKGRPILLNKCKFCGSTQNWKMGNNYNILVKNRTFYCEDSASIFQKLSH